MITREDYADIQALAATYGECGPRVYAAMWNEARALNNGAEGNDNDYFDLLRLRFEGEDV